MRKVFDNQEFFKTINDTLSKKESVSFVVKGHSMSPFLKDGETEVFLKTKNQYKKYDICLFRYKQQYRLHRLLKIKNDLYYFRGDHLYKYEIVNSKDILGFVYQYTTKSKTVKVKDFRYRMKVRLYLIYKSFYMLLRKFYLVIKHGN